MPQPVNLAGGGSATLLVRCQTCMLLHGCPSGVVLEIEQVCGSSFSHVQNIVFALEENAIHHRSKPEDPSTESNPHRFELSTDNPR
jgi:hypothetical protein